MSSKKSTVVISLPDSSKPTVSTVGQKSKGKKRSAKKKSQGSSKLPAAMSSTYKRTDPSIAAGNGRIRVTHREYLGPVSADPVFELESYDLNPGLHSTFPWLSSIAKMYESYIFQQLRIEYVPSCGSTTAGSLVMAIDYDAFDYPPTTRRDFMSQQGCVRSALWDSVPLTAEASNLKKFGVQRYTRAGGLASNLDIKTYDVGKFYYCAEGPLLANCGELFISYVIDLFTPQSPHWDEWSSEKITALGADNINTFPAGGGGSTVVEGNLGVELLNIDRVKFNKAGTYLLDALIDGAPPPGLTPYVNIVPLNFIQDFNSSILVPPVFNQNNKTSQSLRLDIGKDGTVLKVNWGDIVNVVQGVLRFAPYSPLVL